MALNPTCCGCHLVTDYGTSIVGGDGDSAATPYTVSMIDPEFNRPIVKIRRTAAQTIPNNTATAVTYTATVFDTNGMFDLGNPTRLTIPITGLYLMGLYYEWPVSANTAREVFFRLNGSMELDRQSLISANAAVPNHQQNHVYPWFFSAGDYVETLAFQTSGGDLALGVATFPTFWMTYLGKKV